MIHAGESATMAMVSIKRYLNLSTLEAEKPGTALALVLERLGDSVITWDPQEAENFRDDLATITGGLSPALPQKEMLVVAEAAMQATETYNRRIAQTIEKQYRDFQTIIKMLRDSIVKMAGENIESVQCLDRIDEELDRGPGFKDLQSLRMHLGACLPGLRKDVERDQLASKALIERLQIEMESAVSPAERLARRRTDAVTGLPGQKECVEAIGEAIARGTRHYAIVMVVNRVEAISARFGKEAGNWMLSRFREFVESQFEATDLLFRWCGPAIVALVERAQPFDQMRAFVKRVFETPISETIDVNGRSVFVPISAAWSIFTISATPETTEKLIQKFVAGQGCRDVV